MEIEFGGNTLVLLPERAIWMPSANALILSDLHLGSSVNGRSNGFTVPDAVYQDDLNRMDALVNTYGGDVYIVGDLVHMHHNEVWPRFSDLRHTWTSHVTLIAGNHDKYAANHATEFGLDVVDAFDLHGITLIHNPHQTVKGTSRGVDRFKLDEGGPRICGHLHPAIIPPGAPQQNGRVPCFYHTRNTLVLPAFGRFSSAYLVDPSEDDRVYLPRESNVVEFSTLAAVRRS